MTESRKNLAESLNQIGRSARVLEQTREPRGPDTKAGTLGFTVFVLCFCAVLIMLTIKLGVVLFT